MAELSAESTLEEWGAAHGWQPEKIALCHDNFIRSVADVLAISMDDISQSELPLGLKANLKALHKHFQPVHQEAEVPDSQVTEPEWADPEEGSVASKQSTALCRTATWTNRLAHHKVRHPLLHQWHHDQASLFGPSGPDTRVMKQSTHVLFVHHADAMAFQAFRSECEQMALALFDLWYSGQRSPGFNIRNIRLGKYTVASYTSALKNKFEKMKQGATTSDKCPVPDIATWSNFNVHVPQATKCDSVAACIKVVDPGWSGGPTENIDCYVDEKPASPSSETQETEETQEKPKTNSKRKRAGSKPVRRFPERPTVDPTGGRKQRRTSENIQNIRAFFDDPAEAQPEEEEEDGEVEQEEEESEVEQEEEESDAESTASDQLSKRSGQPTVARGSATSLPKHTPPATAKPSATTTTAAPFASRQATAHKEPPPPKPQAKKQEVGQLDKLVNCKDYKQTGYHSHKARTEAFQPLLQHQFKPGDPKLEDFTNSVSLDVADGNFPSPLLVTTFPFTHTDGSQQFGIVCWTRFFDPSVDGVEGDVKVEMCWLTPVQSKQGQVAAFINRFVSHQDLCDVEEEAILDFTCDNGLFMLDPSGKKDVWDKLEDGTPIAHPAVVADRGT